MSLKLTYLPILWGTAGAREKFEDMVAQLIHAERPDSQRVRIANGDGGLDSFEGALTDPGGIDVYQMKYFPSGIAETQKDQIRKSFTTARNHQKFKVKSWTLCLPVEMSLEETEWFEGWAQKQAPSEIEIRKPWDGHHLEGLLLQTKNRSIREAFFREENTEYFRAQADFLEKILHELTQRGTLKMELTGVKTTNAYWSKDNDIVIEMQFCYRVTNIGLRSVPKWDTNGVASLNDDALGKRYVNKTECPLLGSGGILIERDRTLLPTTSYFTEHTVGMIVRHNETFDEIVPRILNATSLTFWPIGEEGPEEKTTLNLAEVLNWATLSASFHKVYSLASDQRTVG